MENLNIDELAKKISTELISSEIFDDSELNESLKHSKLNLSNKYEKPKTILQMVENNSKLTDVLTAANISCTIGGAKSKKTFFSTMIIASLLGYKDYGMKCNLLNKKVVFFDTEQSIYHVQKIGWRLKKLIDNNSYSLFSLRQYEPEKRLAMIDYYLKNNNNYSFVIIDGIVDLLYDFNDLHESKRITTKLMEWSVIYDCHINVILHTNKDKKYARGHLGAELMNKSETVFRITKEDINLSAVDCELSRNMGFETFHFTIENGLPVRNLLPTGFYNNNPDKLNNVKLNSYEFTESEPKF